MIGSDRHPWPRSRLLRTEALICKTDRDNCQQQRYALDQLLRDARLQAGGIVKAVSLEWMAAG